MLLRQRGDLRGGRLAGLLAVRAVADDRSKAVLCGFDDVGCRDLRGDQKSSVNFLKTILQIPLQSIIFICVLWRWPDLHQATMSLFRAIRS